MSEHLILNADGLCEPTNPGGVAAGGWLIVDSDGKELHAGCRVFCEGAGATNNVAEYGALEAGLAWLVEAADDLRSQGYSTLTVRSDSQLAIYQTAGRWNCNKPHLAHLRDKVRGLLQTLKNHGFICSLQWIPREENIEADTLSRKAYRDHTGKLPLERVR